MAETIAQQGQQLFAWKGTVSALLRAADSEILKCVEDAQRQSGFDPSRSQIKAWTNCLLALRPALATAVNAAKELSEWAIVFEYELPRERGRRPDVILLGSMAVLVMEFKDFADISQAHLDQVEAYARDLRYYHSECHDKTVLPALVLTQARGLDVVHGEVKAASPDRLAALFIGLARQEEGEAPVDAARWVAGEYAPLPTLVDAARRLFSHEPLPAIRRAESAGIPWTLKYLEDAAADARGKGERHLALITGVPGAGKTLVGLQFVYQRRSDSDEGETQAVFLSGNGPLVKVLQHALQNRIFVQDVHGFLRQYGGSGTQLPKEHIWVYDEAQRAWDAERVKEKRGHATSEPEDFLKLGARTKGWALMVGLVGEGQEIHLGEEAGLGQWNSAILASGDEWIVHCPPKLQSTFTAGEKVNVAQVLDLSQSLRSHLAEDVQQWIGYVLNGAFRDARRLAPRLTAQGFHVYLTQDLEHAKSYVRQRYEGEREKRYGLVASSKGSNLPEFGVQNGYGHTKNFREGPWYNDPPESRHSCCQLNDVATEFSCQGLELDMPIVCWGSDFRIEGDSWLTPRVTARNTAKNPRQLRVNSYRVLLSRGRDGLLLYVPPEDRMTATAAALRAAGASELVDWSGSMSIRHGVA
ncbi:MAG: DNA/RNA helicase domain-containing protein [Ramlibacter sp.]